MGEPSSGKGAAVPRTATHKPAEPCEGAAGLSPGKHRPPVPEGPAPLSSRYAQLRARRGHPPSSRPEQTRGLMGHPKRGLRAGRGQAGAPPGPPPRTHLAWPPSPRHRPSHGRCPLCPLPTNPEPAWLTDGWDGRCGGARLTARLTRPARRLLAARRRR